MRPLLPLITSFLFAYFFAGRTGFLGGVLILLSVVFLGLLISALSGPELVELSDSFGEIAGRIESLVRRAGLRGVSVYVLEDYLPNAYSTGKKVILSLGLFEVLDEDEVLGVVAHELGHIRNRDTLLFPMLAYLRIFAFLVPFVMWALTASFLTFLLYLTLYIWFEAERSRFLKGREFRADDFAVRILDVPMSLKYALEELKNYEDLMVKVKKGINPGIEPKIERYGKGRAYRKPGIVFFPTHPSYEERIFRIVPLLEELKPRV
ncbi:M48 family metallopeptidase [Thermococcus sp.]